MYQPVVFFFFFLKYNELSIVQTLEVSVVYMSCFGTLFGLTCSWLSCKTFSDQRSLNHWEEAYQRLILYLLIPER